MPLRLRGLGVSRRRSALIKKRGTGVTPENTRAILVGTRHLIELNMERIARMVYSGASPPAPPEAKKKKSPLITCYGRLNRLRNNAQRGSLRRPANCGLTSRRGTRCGRR